MANALAISPTIWGWVVEHLEFTEKGKAFMEQQLLDGCLVQVLRKTKTSNLKEVHWRSASAPILLHHRMWGFEPFGSCSISIMYPVLQRLGRRILLHQHWTHQVQPRFAAAGWSIFCWAKHLTAAGDDRKIRKGLFFFLFYLVPWWWDHSMILHVIVVLPSRQWIFGNWHWMANGWATASGARSGA